MIENGRMNSTENFQKLKYPTNAMTNDQRMEEMEGRIRREKAVAEQEREKYNKMLLQQNNEKNKEMKKDTLRMIENRKMVDKTKRELESLKQEKQKQIEQNTKNELV